MLLEQQQSSSCSPASTLVRGGSEPPDPGFNEVNGLRRARNPIKVAGIMMGSQENLAVNDELAAVFANRRRRRRSATPVKIGGIVMGDGTETEAKEEQQEELPFGSSSSTRVNKRNSYHHGHNPAKRHSSIGMWGQRVFTNGHNFDRIENKEDVKEFLTTMHSEIKAMTHNLTNGDSENHDESHQKNEGTLKMLKIFKKKLGQA